MNPFAKDFVRVARGVYKMLSGKYSARYGRDEDQKYLGTFNTLEEAETARQTAHDEVCGPPPAIDVPGIGYWDQFEDRPDGLSWARRDVCRWPLGDVAIETFRCCGLPIAEGETYCSTHYAAARQSGNSRRAA